MTRRRRGSKTDRARDLEEEEESCAAGVASLIPAVMTDVRAKAVAASEDLDKAIKLEIATAVKLWKPRLCPVWPKRKTNRQGKEPSKDPQRDKLFEAYSSGKITRRVLEEKTGLWFGEILEELGKRGLRLPRVDSSIYWNDKQMALYNSIFCTAAGWRKNVQRANRFIYR